MPSPADRPPPLPEPATDAAPGPAADSPGPRGRLAYRALPGTGGWRADPLRPVARQWAIATAPLLGQGRLFAWRLARSTERLARDPAARATLPLPHADRFFGAELVLSIDPARLQWQLQDTVTDGRRIHRLAQRFLDGGDWSAAREPLSSSVVHLEMAALLDPVQPLRQSAIYRYFLERSAAGAPEQRNAVRLASPALIDAYFAHYAALAAKIRAEGFRPRSALAAAATDVALRSRGIERREREVGIAIGADGEVLRLLGGRHRTAIAQLLGLPRMPVQLRLVHARWLQAQMRRHALPAPAALLAGLRDLAAG